LFDAHSGTNMQHHVYPIAALAMLVCGSVLTTNESQAAGCESLLQLKLPATEISSAEIVPAGAFRVPEARSNAAFERLAEFCRVAATARPSADSEIKLEVWLPERNWNGKLQSVGNGAWAGSIGYTAMADALAGGYAAASTDTGHVGSNTDFVPGHPEKLIDFGSRAIHAMTVAAKAIVHARYDNAPSAAYFVGCSTGGRQALSEAQRYPGDYDGIVAGAPANYVTNLQAAQLWSGLVGHRRDNAALGSERLQAVTTAATDACDLLDGVRDGVIENPAHCSFDPQSLICGSSGSADPASCLSPEQAETVGLLYAGPQTRAGQSLFPGYARGSESGWDGRLGPEPQALAVDTYKVLVYGDDPGWDYRNFDLERDIPVAQERIGAIMNSVDANLAPYFERGGKLLLYHGWNDQGISPFNTIEYFSQVRDTLGARASDDAMRLFMVPGMTHCRGGAGTDSFDAVAALDLWLDTASAPDRIAAARVRDGRVEWTRPLCAYPQQAVYNGSGSTDDAENFTCRTR
jgi:feruloyl esterase